jgi:hypothetical protein
MVQKATSKMLFVLKIQGGILFKKAKEVIYILHDSAFIPIDNVSVLAQKIQGKRFF